MRLANPVDYLTISPRLPHDDRERLISRTAQLLGFDISRTEIVSKLLRAGVRSDDVFLIMKAAEVLLSKYRYVPSAHYDPAPKRGLFRNPLLRWLP
jgi:hypothetical protein